MRLIDVETLKLVEFVGEDIPPYAILSHTWGDDKDEVSFLDIQTMNLAPNKRPVKLDGCCKQAKADGLRFIWIDTCCINKDSATELGEALNSMFQWYRDARICYVYLSDVPDGESPSNPQSKFFSSRWFTRGWTLQELLAPQNLVFYDQTWSFLGSKKMLTNAIERITSIPSPFLLGLADLHEASIAQRMSWAANRVTKRKEDLAYCLLGVFNIVMPIIYGGEGNQAFIRLQEEMLKKTGDDSILAWGLSGPEDAGPGSRPRNLVPGGALAAAPSDFAHCGNIVLRDHQGMPVNTLETVGGRLRVHLPLYTAPDGKLYGLLNCGPESNTDQVVGFPLNKIKGGGSSSEEYTRPKGRQAALLDRTDIPATIIHIRSGTVPATVNRRNWFYIVPSVDLQLVEVYPRDSWVENRDLIMTATDDDGSGTHLYVARFRQKDRESQKPQKPQKSPKSQESQESQKPKDIVVVFEFTMQEPQPEAQHHVMASDRDTALEDLSLAFAHIRPQAFGKLRATIGSQDAVVTMAREKIAGQPMFVVRPATSYAAPEATIDATAELHRAKLYLDYVQLMTQEDQLAVNKRFIDHQKARFQGLVQTAADQLVAMNIKIQELTEERDELVDELHKLCDAENQTNLTEDKIKKEQELALETRRGLEQVLDHSPMAKVWFGETMQRLLDIGGIDNDGNAPPVSPTVKQDGNVPILWAAKYGRTHILQRLVDDGVSVDYDRRGLRPIHLAAQYGHLSTVEMLLQKGADIVCRGALYRVSPLLLAVYNGHYDVVRLLVDNGASVDAGTRRGGSPLHLAATRGHEQIVQLLLNNGAQIDGRDASGNTALCIAVSSGSEPIARFLLRMGANIEMRDALGSSPLQTAAESGNEQVTRLLLEQGANPHAVNKANKTAMALAKEGGHLAVVDLLASFQVAEQQLVPEAKIVERAPADKNLVLFRARAIYSFTATIPEELGFIAGDPLDVFECQRDGWYKAKMVGNSKEVGLVPSNYLKILDES